MKCEEIHTMLEQLIQFFESFSTFSEFPIAEILKSEIDIVLALLMKMDFKDHLEQILDQLVSISVILSRFPESFFSRLVEFKIVDFMMVYIDFQENGDYILIGKLLEFINNLLCNSIEALNYFDNNSIFFDLIWDLDYLLADSGVKQKVIILHLNISSPFLNQLSNSESKRTNGPKIENTQQTKGYR